VIQGPRGEGTFPHLEGLAGPLSRRWQQDGQLHEMRPLSLPGSDKTAQLRPSPTAVMCGTPLRAQIRSPRPPSRGPRGARNHTHPLRWRLTESPLVLFVSVVCSVAAQLFRCELTVSGGTTRKRVDRGKGAEKRGARITKGKKGRGGGQEVRRKMPAEHWSLSGQPCAAQSVVADE
jgi:hypothetical protein